MPEPDAVVRDEFGEGGHPAREFEVDARAPAGGGRAPDDEQQPGDQTRHQEATKTGVRRSAAEPAPELADQVSEDEERRKDPQQRRKRQQRTGAPVPALSQQTQPQHRRRQPDVSQEGIPDPLVAGVRVRPRRWRPGTPPRSRRPSRSPRAGSGSAPDRSAPGSTTSSSRPERARSGAARSASRSASG